MGGRYVSEIEIKTNVEKALKQILELQKKTDELEKKDYKIDIGVDSQKLEKVIGGLEKILDSLGKGTGDFKQFENLSKELSGVISEVQSLSKAFGKVDDSGTKTLLSSIQSIDKSLSELSQHITNVNKDFGSVGKNATDNVGQINEARKATEGLTDATKGLARAQQNLNGNKSNISSGNSPIKDVFQNENTSASVKEETSAIEQVETAIQEAAQAKASEKVWNDNLEAIQKYFKAKTELNNLEASDTGKNKKTDQIADKRRQVEELRVEAEKARATISSMLNPHHVDDGTWKEYLQMMDDFRQAGDGSSQSIAKISDAVKNLNTSELEKLQKYIDSTQANLNKTNASRPDNEKSSDFESYVEKVQGYINALIAEKARLEEALASGDIKFISDDLKGFENLQKEITKTELGFKTLFKGSSENSRKKEIDTIRKALQKNTKFSAEAKEKLEGYINLLKNGGADVDVNKIHIEFLDVVEAERLAKREGQSFIDVLKDKVWYQWAAQIGNYLSLNDLIRYAKQGIETIKELDTAMVEVKKVSDETEASYAKFSKTISSTAKEIASTNAELLNSSADYLRLGYNLDEAAKLAENTALFVNVGDGVDIEEATEDIITAMKAFNIEAEDSMKIVDSYNQIGNLYALSASDIGEAMKRSASALEASNNSFEDSIGLITAMTEIAQDAETTGTSLKVLSLRIRGAKADLESMNEDTDGLADSTSKMRKEIQALTGVDIMIDEDTFKSTADIIKELGAVWDSLTDVSQAATLELIAGKSRSNAVAALIQNYERIDEVIADLENAEGSALKENEAIVDSIEGRIKILSATVEEFWASFKADSLIKDVISGATTLLELLTKIVDKAGLLGTLSLGGGLVAEFKNVGGLKMHSLIIVLNCRQ